jgi:hypothetical protein
MLSRTLRFRLGSLPRFFRPGFLVWELALIAGFYFLISYQMRAGQPGPAFARWPANAGLPFDPQRYNLVMFAHPKCPCTRASLDELEIVLAQRRREIKATVCFIDPEDAPATWTDTSLEQAARRIPGLTVVLDRGETVAKKFGAMTSGQVAMFDPLGRGVFSGGITGSRGHAGENRGRDLVLALAGGARLGSAQTPVFGCALHEATTAEARVP